MNKSLPIILCIETATKMCSVALYKGENLLAIKEQGGAYAHAENLTVFIQQVISDAQISFNQLSAIAVSKGPGSYTGLRIGVSTAKGLAYALNKPIIGIDTLTSMANLARQKINYQNEFLCPMIDARRMEVYCAIFDQNQNIIKPISADIITENVFDKYIGESKIVIFGDGSQKCKELFKNKTNYIFLQDEFISAKGLIIPALKKLNNNELDDVVYFEPFYLKDFISSSSKT
ncbi:MAG: tRNA (adenosine(37)-N6)-threonylcarbamoyltransferase complex dimerization subunit type 1 TsaB [Bacteroidia bacterium]